MNTWFFVEFILSEIAVPTFTYYDYFMPPSNARDDIRL